MPFPVGAAVLGGLNMIGSLASGAIQENYAQKNMALQYDYAKKLADYEWANFKSPKAQVGALAQAGLSPAALSDGGSVATPSVGSMPSVAAPTMPNLVDLSGLSSYLIAAAQAKKAGVEIPQIEQQTKNLQIEADAKKYELDLQKFFAAPERATALRLAWQDVMLKQDEHSINEWSKAKEKALSEAKESERDILRKELDNMDTKIQLSNELLKEQGKTERAKQGELGAAAESHRASAEASRTQADVNRENRRLQAALADIEESSKTDKIASLISRYHADGAISDADYSEAMLKLGRLSGIEDKRSTPFFREVDNFTDWLKSKISIFK